MPISFAPHAWTILRCDFDEGFKEPEMVKRRPVLVVSPAMKGRVGLCTVVSLSTTPPNPIMPYHYELTLDVPLPQPWSSASMWIKGDMVNTVAFHRLDLIRIKDLSSGQRIYYREKLNPDQIRMAKTCILNGLGLQTLTRHVR
jgi:uncharacterized protein YifN (PemK superfamily)